MANNIRGITVEIGGDTTKLGKALEDSNKTIKETQNELKTIDKLSKLDPKNLSNYIEKQKSLASAINATKEKLNVLQTASKQVENQFKNGEISKKQYEDFQLELVQTKNKLKDLESQTISVKSVIGKLGSVAGTAGTAMAKGLAVGVKAVAAAGTAATAAIVGLTLKAGEAADEINTIAKQTGLSVEEIQKFQYATDIIDVSLETLTGSMAKNIKSMDSASKGSGEAADAYTKLGIKVTDANGDLRDSKTVYNETIKALGNVTNSTERDALAMAILGKSAQDLNPLILGGADALEALGQEAEDAGLILSQDMLDGLNAVTDAQDKFKSTLSATGNIIAGTFANQITGVINQLTDFVNRLREAYSKDGLGGLTTEIGNILSEILEMISDAIPEMLEMGTELIVSLLEGITSDPDKLINTIMKIITTIINLITNNLPKIIDMGVKLIVALVQGLVQSIPTLVPALLDMMASIVSTIIDALPSVVEVGKQIVAGIWQGIASMASWLYNKVAEFFSNIVKGAKKVLDINSPSGVFADMIGKPMALGVGKGFINQMSAVKGAIGASLANTSNINVNMNNSFTGGNYTSRDGSKIARQLNRQLGYAYR